MVRADSSVQRVFTQFKDISLSDISRVQSSYATQDFQRIREVLNKPTQSEGYIKALGRLANQYINMLDQPSDSDKRVIRRKYDINLTDDFNENLNRAGNIEEEDSDEPERMGQDLTTEEIITMGGNLSENRRGNRQTSIQNPNINRVISGINLIDNSMNRIDNELGIGYYRAYLKILATSGNIIWVSTPILPIGSANELIQFIEDFQNMADETLDYDYKEIMIEQLQEILEVRIEYLD